MDDGAGVLPFPTRLLPPDPYPLPLPSATESPPPPAHLYYTSLPDVRSTSRPLPSAAPVRYRISPTSCTPPLQHIPSRRTLHFPTPTLWRPVSRAMQDIAREISWQPPGGMGFWKAG
ncbi:unnamed protein product [Peniophora sp. CBMAI 1063]|nr:unnamed protein product [Peniophora sp. CBMAI 1063]